MCKNTAHHPETPYLCLSFFHSWTLRNSHSPVCRLLTVHGGHVQYGLFRPGPVGVVHGAFEDKSLLLKHPHPAVFGVGREEKLGLVQDQEG